MAENNTNESTPVLITLPAVSSEGGFVQVCSIAIQPNSPPPLTAQDAAGDGQGSAN